MSLPMYLFLFSRFSRLFFHQILPKQYLNPLNFIPQHLFSSIVPHLVFIRVFEIFIFLPFIIVLLLFLLDL